MKMKGLFLCFQSPYDSCRYGRGCFQPGLRDGSVSEQSNELNYSDGELGSLRKAPARNAPQAAVLVKGGEDIFVRGKLFVFS